MKESSDGGRGERPARHLDFLNFRPWHSPGASRDHVARSFASLGHPSRLAILNLIATRPEWSLTAGAIARELGISPSLLSSHLKLLTESGLVDWRREGARRLFAPSSDHLRRLAKILSPD